MASPHAQPSWAQLVAVGVHGGITGASHWKGVTMPQYSPCAQEPVCVPFTVAQLKDTVVPQPS